MQFISLDQDTMDREARDEAASMEEQAMFMIDEVEDINAVFRYELAQDDEYRMALGTYEQSLHILNISDRESFPFLKIDPISLGRSKESMFTHLYPAQNYAERKLLYVTKTFEYFADGQRFNKRSRRWTYFPSHLQDLLWSLCKLGAVIGVA